MGYVEPDGSGTAKYQTKRRWHTPIGEGGALARADYKSRARTDKFEKNNNTNIVRAVCAYVVFNDTHDSFAGNCQVCCRKILLRRNELIRM